MHNFNTVARPYAQAWLECAQQEDSVADFTAALVFFADVAQLPEVAQFLQDPTVTAENKLELFKFALQQYLSKAASEKLSQYLESFLKLLAANSRLIIFPEILHRFKKLLLADDSCEDITVRLPFAISDAEKDLLTTKLQSYYSGKGEVNYDTADHSLLGGIKVYRKDHVLDYSIADQLKKLASKMAIKNYQPLTERE